MPRTLLPIIPLLALLFVKPVVATEAAVPDPTAGRIDPPVTVAVSRTARAGCEAAMGQALRDIIDARTDFPGHIGTKVLEPGPGDRRFQVLMSFDHASAWEAWRQSPDATARLARIEALTDGRPTYQMATGLEAWFTAPGPPDPAMPDRAKQTFVTWLTIFPLVLGISTLTGPYLAPFSPVLRTAITTGVLVPTFSYIALPNMNWLFDDWLRPKPGPCPL